MDDGDSEEPDEYDDEEDGESSSSSGSSNTSSSLSSAMDQSRMNAGNHVISESSMLEESSFDQKYLVKPNDQRYIPNISSYNNNNNSTVNQYLADEFLNGDSASLYKKDENNTLSL